MSAKQHKVEEAHKDAIFTVDWFRHTSENQLLTGSVDETVASWVMKDQKGKEEASLNMVFPEHSLGTISVVGNPTHPIAISSAMDTRIRILDLVSGAVKSTVDVGPVECWKMACAPNGAKMASGTHTGAINIWDIETHKLENTLETQAGFALTTAYSADGKLIATGTKDGAIFIFDLASGKQIASLTNHTLPVRSLAFSPDGAVLYSASDDMTVGIYDAVKGSQIGSLRGHLSWVMDVAASPDKRLVATGSSDNTVKLWDVIDRSCVQTFEKSHTGQVHGVSFNHDGSRLASVGGEGTIQTYTISTPTA